MDTALSRRALSALLLAALPGVAASQGTAGDPLPSWREGATKRAILDFLTATSTEGGAGLRAACRAPRDLRQ